MTIDPIAAAIDHIRSVTPADNPWTADDVSSFSPWEPDESDYAIATILNAVVAGQLINRASRDEMLAQVRRGEGFATAGAEGRWIADSDAGVYDADAPDPIAAARALLEPLTGYTPGPWWAAVSDHPLNACAYVNAGYHGVATLYGSSDDVPQPAAGEPWGPHPIRDATARLIAAAPDLRDMVATLADALEAERVKVAAAYEAAASIARSHIYYDSAGSGFREDEFDNTIRALTPADAQADLDKMLAEARLEGWRAGRDAAADHCWAKRDLLADAEKKQVAAGLSGRDYYGRRLEAELLSRSIRALPEPKEASHG